MVRANCGLVPSTHTPTTPLVQLRTATTANPEQPPLSQHLSASTRRAAVQLRTTLIGGVDLVGKVGIMSVQYSCIQDTSGQFVQMYTGRMEEEKIGEMFDEVSTECCVCVCVCVQPTWHLPMKTVSLSPSGLTAVLLTHTHRETTTQNREGGGGGRRRVGRGVREEESRKGSERGREEHTQVLYCGTYVYTPG